MDDWWEGDRRPAVLTPHTGEFARLRAGSGDRATRTATWSPTTRPGWRRRRDAATTLGPGGRPQGRADDHRRARTAAAAIAPFENPALATGGTGDVLAGAIGSLLAQGLRAVRRRAARRLPPRAGRRRGPRAVRRRRAARLGPARRDRDRPQAAGRHRRAQGRGQAARVRGTRLDDRVERGGRRSGRVRRRRDATPATRRAGRADDPSRPMTPVTPRRPIERRLAAAGLPPLPRTAWLEIDLDALRDNLAALRVLAGPGVPVRPVVKADAYGHGAIPVARALEAAGADGFCVAAVDEALELRDAGIRAPDPRALSGPRRRSPPRPPGAEIAVAAGDAAGLAATSSRPRAGSIRRGRCRRRARGRDRARSRRVRRRRGRRRGRERRGRRAGVRLAGLWTHLQAAEDAGDHGGPGGRASKPRVAAVARGRDRAPAPPRGRERGPPHRRLLAYDGVRPGLAVYGLVPDELGAGRPARSRADRAPGHGAHRPPGPRRGPAGRLGHQLRADVPDDPAEPDRDAARRLRRRLGAGALEPGRARIVRGLRVPLVGNVAMDAVMADVTDVPGPPVDADDEFVLLGLVGRRADHRRGPGAGAHHELVGGRDRDGSAASSGVPCRGGAGRSADAHRAERIAWRASSSGTATSATWRSTPS